MNSIQLEKILHDSIAILKNNKLTALAVGAILNIPTIIQSFIPSDEKTPIVFVSLVLIFFIQIYATVSSNCFLLDLIRNKGSHFKKFVDIKTLTAFWRVLLQACLLLFILLPPILITFAISLYLVSSFPSNIAFIVIAVLVGLIFLFISIYLFLRLYMASYLALENNKIISNIKRSWLETKGHLLKILVIFLITAIPLFVMNFATYFLPPLLRLIISTLSSLIISPFAAICFISLYNQIYVSSLLKKEESNPCQI